MDYILASFTYEKSKYVFKGDIVIEKRPVMLQGREVREALGADYFPCPVYENLTITVDGEEYVPDKTNFMGHVFDASEMLANVLFHETVGGELFQEVVLCEELQGAVDFFHKESNLVMLSNGKTLKRIIWGELIENEYHLLIATDQYVYYYHDDETIMLSMDDMSVISDNYFAEVGLFDSIEDIKQGKEILLFGELPEE